MRGPQDTFIDSQEGFRPPGGKLLQRQLQWLESAGFTEAAAAAIQTAVDEETRAEFQTRDVQFTATPTGQPTDFTAVPEAGVGIATEEIAQLFRDTAERLGPPTAAGPQWRSLGPTTIPNGQTYGSSRVNVSGRIASVIVDSENSAHVLVGTANGGVWESFDRGGSWEPRSDYAATLSVGVLAFDPSDSSIVYCGTGEGNAWYNAPLGVGILRSSDGGTTWVTLCTNPFVGQGFYDLIVDPADGQHLLAGTTNGLYVSTDGGVTWIQRRAVETWSLSIAPGGSPSAEIIAGCIDGLWSSPNGGNTWTQVSLPGAPGSFNRLEADIAPSNPSVAYAWGAISSGAAFLWRRAGGIWTALATPPGVQTGQAWYDWFVAAAPDSDTQVYCGAIQVHRGDLTGGGWTWINLTNKGSTGDSIHPDQHAIAFEPGNPDTIYVGNDGGLYRSNDRGINWQHCNNGLVITEFEYLAQDPNSAQWLIGGTQDNGTQRWTGSSVHDHVADGDGGDCGVNQSNPDIVFHTYFRMSPERSTSRGNFGTWTFIPPPVPSGEGSLFYPPFETSATNGDTIAMGGDALYVSRNNGSSWTRLTYPSRARASAMYIPNADRVYVGTTSGQIFRTEWNGLNWAALTALITPRSNAYVSDLFVDPNNLLRMWATHRTVGGGRVFRSDNGGSSWSDRTAGLPGLPINAIAIDPTNDGRIWVAADLGVYQSLDGGATWSDFSNGLPHMVVGDILFHPSNRLLRAGTRNRGIWEISVDGTPPLPELEINGQEVLGAINFAGESDLYTFRVATEGRYTIETSGTIDTFLSLFGPDSETNLIATDDDSGPGTLSLLVQDLDIGQYFVRVRHFSSRGTGSYGISVRSNTDPEPVRIQVNGPEVQGNIGEPAESDLFTFNVVTAEEHIIETSGTTDTFLALFGPNSDTDLITQDDDSGPGLLSRIQEFLAVGTYFVRVRHYSPTRTGAYGVRVRRV
ncbi:MAG: hypothetical protein AB4040_02455 [Synechococcus sp.]